MILVPENGAVDVARAPAPVNDFSELDRDMEKILNDKHLSDFIKWKRYEATLDRYMMMIRRTKRKTELKNREESDDSDEDSEVSTMDKILSGIKNRYIVPTLRYQYECDLAEFQPYSNENKNVRYLLVVIDVFSRYAQVEPLVDKTGRAVADGLRKIFKLMGTPILLRSDKGTEFISSEVQKLLKQLFVKHITTNNEVKCAIVERFIRTIKTKLYKYFTNKGHHKYVDRIKCVVRAYNNSWHSSIGCEPANVTSRNVSKIWKYLYSGVGRYPKLQVRNLSKPKFKVGDVVKISSKKNSFSKGYKHNFTYENFVIDQVLRRNPQVFRLKDLEGVQITGVFYAEELQKVITDDKTAYKIDYVIKSRGKAGSRQLYVKWRGYPDAFNSWIKATDLEKL
ncbi:uncharacterized protein LOC135945133 [Cloeon dipterum]|uniref:uncharacterized protein LOC135945133 n=1 Tax=Cloeon dipterum TaxID=197152 RepID=UPI00322063D9